MVRRLVPLAWMILLALTACAPEEIEIPTVVLLPTVPPEQAATQTAAAYATSIAPPTLPPSWTPLPSPAWSPTPEALPPAGGPVSVARGRFIFVADGAIQTVNADGTGLTTLTPALAASDLTLAPDRQTLAFAAMGPNNARELFVLELASGVARQVTWLGMEIVVDPAWHPDGDRLVFAAGQGDGARQVYTVRPDGQELVQVTALPARDPDATPDSSTAEGGSPLTALGLSDPIFTPDGGGIIFAAPSLAMVDLATGDVTPLTIGSGWGNDASPRWRPGTTQLVYIRSLRGELFGGPLHSFDLNTLAGESVPPVLVDLPIQQFVFSRDGRYLAMASGTSVQLMDFTLRAARELTDTGDVLPSVAINRDGSRIAYFGSSITGGKTPQLIIAGRSGRDRWAVIDLTAQSLSDLLWIETE